MKTCKVELCNSDATRVGAQLCEKHYGRVRRHGNTDLEVMHKEGLIEHSQGYLMRYAPDHPLTRGKASRVYEHRAIYYDANPNKELECYHCGKDINWTNLHIDHLDNNKKNNDISNLVSSCPPCNHKRGHAKMKRTCRANGINIELNGITKHIAEWAEDLGISRQALRTRLKLWSKEEALTKKKGKTGPK